MIVKTVIFVFFADHIQHWIYYSFPLSTVALRQFQNKESNILSATINMPGIIHLPMTSIFFVSRPIVINFNREIKCF